MSYSNRIAIILINLLMGILVLIQKDEYGYLLVDQRLGYAIVTFVLFGSVIWHFAAGITELSFAEYEEEDEALDMLKNLYLAASPVANKYHDRALHNALGNTEVFLDDLGETLDLGKFPVIGAPRTDYRSSKLDALFENTGSFQSLKDRHQ